MKSKPPPPSPSAPPSAPASTVPPIVGPEGATLVRTLTGTCIAKTSKGYAVAAFVVGLDGSVSVRLGPSQSELTFVAIEHKKNLARLAQSLL